MLAASMVVQSVVSTGSMTVVSKADMMVVMRADEKVVLMADSMAVLTDFWSVGVKADTMVASTDRKLVV